MILPYKALSMSYNSGVLGEKGDLLPDMLGNYSNEILSMVYAHCLNYQSINNMSDWYKRTDLPVLLNLKNATEKNPLKKILHLRKLIATQPSFLIRMPSVATRVQPVASTQMTNI